MLWGLKMTEKKSQPQDPPQLNEPPELADRPWRKRRIREGRSGAIIRRVLLRVLSILALPITIFHARETPTRHIYWFSLLCLTRSHDSYSLKIIATA